MSDCPIHGHILCDAHDFWCDAPKCLGACNCQRPIRLAEHEVAEPDGGAYTVERV